MLLAGVATRYVFHVPLIWTDELASILFLWLVMLGSVIALQWSEHMRLTRSSATCRRSGGRGWRRWPQSRWRYSC